MDSTNLFTGCRFRLDECIAGEDIRAGDLLEIRYLDFFPWVLFPYTSGSSAVVVGVALADAHKGTAVLFLESKSGTIAQIIRSERHE